MPVESANYIAELDDANPSPSDPKSQGDDHLRMLKSVLLASFKGFGATVIVYGEDEGTGNAYVVSPDLPVPLYGVGMLVTFKASHTNTGPATLNVSDVGAVEIRHTTGKPMAAGDIRAGMLTIVQYDGVQFHAIGGSPLLSRVGDQSLIGDFDIDGDLDLTGEFALGGNIIAAGPGVNNFAAGRTLVQTLPPGSSDSNDAASVAFVNQLALALSLPAQLGKAGKYLRTNGLTATWEDTGTIKHKTVSATYTVQASDISYLLDVTAAVTLTLPAMYDGFQFIVRNRSAGNVTISSAAQIDGRTSYVLRPGVSKIVQSNGTTYRAIHLSAPLIKETYTASGTFTKDPDDVAYIVELIGAGAAGAASESGSPTGGSGGGYLSCVVGASAVPASVDISIGAGGTPSSRDGGNTAFGQLFSVRGGTVSQAGGGERVGSPGIPAVGGYSSGGGGYLGPGGSCVMGGAGGASPNTTGGRSSLGGDGGDGQTGSTPAQNGKVPGGGGGAGTNLPAGSGARGEARIYRIKG